MASIYDECISNFDLNHLGNSEEIVQRPEPNHEKRRRSIFYLKGRICGTDDMIQKLVSVTEDYKQVLKAHSATKEELKHACINYKEVQETCSHLENEKKSLQANQEILLKKVSEAENKYIASLSHLNQLQALVKELEIEKQALIIEKQIDNSKDKMLLLQKENETMKKDIISLKQVILGKKRKTSRIIKLLNSNSEQKDPDIYTSDDSSDEMASSSNSKSKNHKEPALIGNESFIDYDSDSTSDHTNKHNDSCQKSPGSHNFETIPKLIDKTKSPLKSKSPGRSIFDPEGQYENTCDNEIEGCVKKVVNSCTSPVFKAVLVDIGTDPIENVNNIEPTAEANKSPLSMDLEEIKETKQTPMIYQKPNSKCLCLKSDSMITDKAICVDSGTSPISELLLIESFQGPPNVNKHTVEIGTQTTKVEFVEMGTSTISELFISNITELINEEKISMTNDSIEDANNRKYSEKHTRENETQTEEKNSIELKKKKLVDASTSPVFDVLLIERQQNAIQMSNNHKKKTADIDTQTINRDQTTNLKFVDSCTSPINCNVISLECNEKSNSNEDEISRCNEHDISTETHNLQLFTREKMCLENNSSNNLHNESIGDDAEVQNILSVMKLNRKLLSPLPRTPYNVPCPSSEFRCSEQRYFALMDGINKILNIIGAKVSNTVENDESMNLDTVLEESLFGQQCEITDAPVALSEEVEEENINMSITSKNNSPSEKSVDLTTEESTDVNTTDTCYRKKLNAETTVGACKNSSRIDIKSIPIKTLEPRKEIGLDDLNKETETVENNLETNKVIRSESELCSPNNYKNKNASKLKKKSKLEKLRHKLIPTNKKIRKANPSVTKRVLKVRSINREDVNLTKLKQKMAYEKAVKVMAELKSNQKIETKSDAINLVAEDGVLENRSDNINEVLSPPYDSKMITTRNQKSSLNKKEENTVSHTKDTTIDIEKSSSGRKSRKCSSDLSDAINLVAEDGVLENRSDNVNEILSPPYDSKIITTTNQKSSLNEKEENTASHTGLVIEHNPVDIEKSSPSRKSRKRSSDLKLDYLQGSFKRVLRSSNDHKIDVSIDNSTGRLKKLDIQKKQPSDANTSEQSLSVLGDIVKNIMHKAQGNGINDMKLNIEEHNNQNICMATENSNTLTDSEITKTLKVTKKSLLSLNADHVKSDVNNELNDLQVSRNKDVAKTTSSNETKSNTRNIANDSCIMKDVGNTEPVQGRESSLNLQDSEESKSNSMASLKYGSPQKKIAENNINNINLKSPVVTIIPLQNDIILNLKNNSVRNSDMDVCVEETVQKAPSSDTIYLKDNILFTALDKYGLNKIKFVAKKMPESITNKICQTLEEKISKVITSPSSEQKNKMNEIVTFMNTFKIKQILSGFIKYLKDPSRKCELFNKIQTGPAPPMTKAEAVLLYVIEQLNSSFSAVNFLHLVYKSIEHSLFQLNHSPHFDVIESMSHFYAVMCRYFRNNSRLRCFMLDAMYCLQFKAVPIIKHCLEVCPGVLPYATEHMAKTSLVTCLVYLLHFYKCNDDKYNRTQEIRNILSRKYRYQFSEWSETVILEIFRKAIMNIKDIHNDKKMLRIALIILCKRHGTNWCQTKIIQNMLLPIIQNPDVPEKIKHFCVSMLGPLLKPFPANKKAQCEIAINQLLQLLKQNPSHEMKEAIYSSLIFVSKHDQERVVQALLSWNPLSVSQDFQEILNDYVMEKPLEVWKRLVSQPSQRS